MDKRLQLKHMEEVLEGLALILPKAELIANGHADHSALKEIADYLTQIRFQLSELLKVKAGLTDEHGTALKEIAARYFRLEGRIKEIRNDREPARERWCRTGVRKHQ